MHWLASLLSLLPPVINISFNILLDCIGICNQSLYFLFFFFSFLLLFSIAHVWFLSSPRKMFLVAIENPMEIVHFSRSFLFQVHLFSQSDFSFTVFTLSLLLSSSLTEMALHFLLPHFFSILGNSIFALFANWTTVIGTFDVHKHTHTQSTKHKVTEPTNEKKNNSDSICSTLKNSTERYHGWEEVDEFLCEVNECIQMTHLNNAVLYTLNFLICLYTPHITKLFVCTFQVSGYGGNFLDFFFKIRWRMLENHIFPRFSESTDFQWTQRPEDNWE